MKIQKIPFISSLIVLLTAVIFQLILMVGYAQATSKTKALFGLKHLMLSVLVIPYIIIFGILFILLPVIYLLTKKVEIYNHIIAAFFIIFAVLIFKLPFYKWLIF